jgi:hypothetical protein
MLRELQFRLEKDNPLSGFITEYTDGTIRKQKKRLIKKTLMTFGKEEKKFAIVFFLA